MEKTFIKQGIVNICGVHCPTPVKITLIHSGEEYFYKNKETRVMFNELESIKAVLKAKKLNRKIFKTSGNWYVKNWQFETVTDKGEKIFWSPTNQILEVIENKEDIEILLNEKPEITQIIN